MKTFSILTVTLFLLYILSGCSHKTYPTGNFQETAVTADGDLHDWSLPLRYGTTSGGAQYNVTNDNENIYISLQTHDEITALKILRAGVNIYIDPTTKESKTIDLSFPLPAPTSLYSGNQSQSKGAGQPDKSELRKSLLLQANVFKISGFQNIENRLYDKTDQSKIKIGLKSGEDNSLSYEAIIPLKYIYGTTEQLNSKAHNLSVGIVINAMQANREHANSSGYNGGGMHGGGMGGGGMHRGGGISGGGGGHRQNPSGSGGENNNMHSPDRTALFKADVNWYKFKLAVKN